MFKYLTIFPSSSPEIMALIRSANSVHWALLRGKIPSNKILEFGSRLRSSEIIADTPAAISVSDEPPKLLVPLNLQE